MSVQEQQNVVERYKKHSCVNYSASHVILKINRKVEYPEEEEWVTDQLNLHWHTGIPISMKYLMQLLRQHVVCRKLFDDMLKSSKAPAKNNPRNGCDELF